MDNRIQETRCKNGAKIIVSRCEVKNLKKKNGEKVFSYRVESTNSADTRFFGWFSNAMQFFNSLVIKNNV